jgi:hypothetical protein
VALGSDVLYDRGRKGSCINSRDMYKICSTARRPYLFVECVSINFFGF